jgi:hypothetical protein
MEQFDASFSKAVKADVKRQMSQPQRHQVHEALAAAQRLGCRDLSSLRCRRRAGTPKKSAPVDTIDAVLASGRGGVDQSANIRIEREPATLSMAA